MENMLKYLIISLNILLIASCKKNMTDIHEVSQDFFVAFSCNDSNYKYETGKQYQYLRGGSQGDFPQSLGLDFATEPSTYISPLPTNLGIETVGFEFGLEEIFSDFTIHWVDLGDSLFRKGSRLFCNQEINCLDGNHMKVFWTFKSIRMNSSYSGQPSDSYFYIDSVQDYHHTENLNLKIYDKIITGRFQCKIFTPGDTTVSKELINGTFRMPVWRNGQDGI
jgi:hypothetical protein